MTDLRTSVLSASIALAAIGAGAAEDRPNILWITAEDMSPDLGCYGDPYATSPNIDRLAGRSVRYTHAFATAPVCSPARSTLITGVYATSLGTQRLRSQFPIPEAIEGFPAYLRRSGYFTTNNVKTDYNVADEAGLIRACWDRNGPEAHWRDRPDRDRPFFSVFNLMTTHQSRAGVWPRARFEAEVASRLSPEDRHDPSEAPVPPYYPDVPEVRDALARYHDCITAMDAEVGALLAELEADGLADDTIVFFYSDHGMGLPRGKRVLHDSGLRVPLLIHVPDRFSRLSPVGPGETTDRLVSFVDFAPTALALAGVPIPGHMQGSPFLGPDPGDPRRYVFGARDRVDEAYDLSRSARDGRFLYIRNFMPHLSWMQPERYSDAAEIRQALWRLRDKRGLGEGPLTYAAPRKAVEELYDTQADPHQVRNLADDPEHRETLHRLRDRLHRWRAETRDLGFLSETDAWRRIRSTTLYELARDPVPLSRIYEAADLVGRPGAVSQQAMLLEDPDPAVRYWGAVGLHAAEGPGQDGRAALRAALDDPSVAVRVEAASALAGLGEPGRSLPVLVATLTLDQPEAVLRAVRALELLGGAAAPARPALRAMLDRAREAEASSDDPCWMFVRFSAEAALEGLDRGDETGPVD